MRRWPPEAWVLHGAHARGVRAWADLLPLLQMTPEPPLTFLFSRWWARFTTQPKEFYDEAYRRMDGWMGGRRDVDLDGDRGTGGGSAGRRD